MISSPSTSNQNSHGGLSAESLEAVFPFLIGFDDQGRIVKWGRSLQLFNPRLPLGEPLLDYFEMRRPTVALDAASLRKHPRSLFLLESRTHNLLLRGQMVVEAQITYFLGSPWLSNLAQMNELGLKISHFAVHDPISDYLFAIQNHQNALAETEKLAARLDQKHQQLRQVNQELREEIVRREHSDSLRSDAMQELQASEDRYRQLFINSKAVKLLIDEGSGTIVDANPAACAYYGYPWADLTQMTIAEINLLAENKLRPLRQEASQSQQQNHLQHRLGSGEIRDVEVFSGPVLTKQAPLIHSIVLDVTDRNRALATLQTTTSRLQALIRNLQAAILVEDENRHIVVANQQFCDLFGIPAPPEVLVGLDCSQSAQQSKGLFANPEHFVDRIAQILQAQDTVTNEQLELQDGRILERDYVPIFQQEYYRGHLWVYRDITARIHAKTELRRSLEREQELGELKSRFIAMASHEFRTPLGTILFSTSMLQRYEGQWEPERRLTHIQRIKGAVEDMTGLLNDVLVLGKVGAGRLVCEPTPLDPLRLCQTLLEDIAALNPGQHQLILEGTPGPLIPLDEKLLRPVLANLLANACKYSPFGSRVWLRCHIENDSLHFQITDEGMGIPPADLPHLFEPFHRGQNVGDRQGTGLGLTVVKRFVELQGGSIACRTNLGQGSCFTVTIPTQSD
jgi:PAS domain S-box-containing protein